VKRDRIEQKKDKIVGINYHPDPGEKREGKSIIPDDEIPRTAKAIGKPLRKSRSVKEFEERMINSGQSGEILAED